MFFCVFLNILFFFHLEYPCFLAGLPLSHQNAWKFTHNDWKFIQNDWKCTQTTVFFVNHIPKTTGFPRTKPGQNPDNDRKYPAFFWYFTSQNCCLSCVGWLWREVWRFKGNPVKIGLFGMERPLLSKQWSGSSMVAGIDKIQQVYSTVKTELPDDLESLEAMIQEWCPKLSEISACRDDVFETTSLIPHVKIIC